MPLLSDSHIRIYIFIYFLQSYVVWRVFSNKSCTSQASWEMVQSCVYALVSKPIPPDDHGQTRTHLIVCDDQPKAICHPEKIVVMFCVESLHPIRSE